MQDASQAPQKAKKPGPVPSMARSELNEQVKKYWPQVPRGPFSGAYALLNSKIHPDIRKYSWEVAVQRCYDAAAPIAKKYGCSFVDAKTHMRE